MSKFLQQQPLILASGSVIRQKLLQSLGLGLPLGLLISALLKLQIVRF